MVYEIKKGIIHFNNPHEALNARGAVVHETANPGDSDEMEQKYFDTADRQASAHAFIDADSITQTVEWGQVAWHAGRTANHMLWGIELCHSDDPDKFDEIWKRGVWLFAKLFTEVAMPRIFTVTKFNLMSHAEVSDEWKETDHVDPVDYFAKHGKTVDMFRGDVQGAVNDFLFGKALTCKAIAKTPDYWLKHAVKGDICDGGYVAQLIKNFVAIYKPEITDINACIDYMVAAKVINKPTPTSFDWKAAAKVGNLIAGETVHWLIIAMGRSVA